jgi:hypothetical protein
VTDVLPGEESLHYITGVGWVLASEAERHMSDDTYMPLDKEAAYNALRAYGLFGYQAAEVLHDVEACGGPRLIVVPDKSPMILEWDGIDFTLTQRSQVHHDG